MKRRRKNLNVMNRSILLLALLSSSSVSSFNLDTRIPVIKTAGADAEAYFGYSVAQHKTAKGPRGETLILVGAPRDNNLQPGTSRSGALWQCPFDNQIKVRELMSTTRIKTSVGREKNIRFWGKLVNFFLSIRMTRQ